MVNGWTWWDLVDLRPVTEDVEIIFCRWHSSLKHTNGNLLCSNKWLDNHFYISSCSAENSLLASTLPKDELYQWSITSPVTFQICAPCSSCPDLRGGVFINMPDNSTWRPLHSSPLDNHRPLLCVLTQMSPLQNSIVFYFPLRVSSYSVSISSLQWPSPSNLWDIMHIAYLKCWFFWFSCILLEQKVPKDQDHLYFLYFAISRAQAHAINKHRINVLKWITG